MNGEADLKRTFDALAGKVIFIHCVKGSKPNKQLPKVIQRLHGEISEFFDSRVHMVVTNRPDPPLVKSDNVPSPLSDIRSSPAGFSSSAPSPASQSLSVCQLSPMNNSPFASPFTSYSPAGLTKKASSQSSVASSSLSRGQKMTLMARHASAADDIVEKAVRRNLLVMTIKDFWRWFHSLPTEVQIFAEEIEPKVVSEDKKLDQAVGLRSLRKPCYKVLDLKSQERPLFMETTNFEPRLWPAEDFNTEATDTQTAGSKRASVSAKNDKEGRKGAAAAQKRWKKKLAKIVEKQTKPARVNLCEGCHTTYKKLDKHLVSEKHQQYAEKAAEHLKSVDDLIKKLPTFAEVIKIAGRRLKERQNRSGSSVDETDAESSQHQLSSDSSLSLSLLNYSANSSMPNLRRRSRVSGAMRRSGGDMAKTVKENALPHAAAAVRQKVHPEDATVSEDKENARPGAVTATVLEDKENARPDAFAATVLEDKENARPGAVAATVLEDKENARPDAFAATVLEDKENARPDAFAATVLEDKENARLGAVAATVSEDKEIARPDVSAKNEKTLFDAAAVLNTDDVLSHTMVKENEKVQSHDSPADAEKEKARPHDAIEAVAKEVVHAGVADDADKDNAQPHAIAASEEEEGACRDAAHVSRLWAEVFAAVPEVAEEVSGGRRRRCRRSRDSSSSSSSSSSSDSSLASPARVAVSAAVGVVTSTPLTQQLNDARPPSAGSQPSPKPEFSPLSVASTGNRLSTEVSGIVQRLAEPPPGPSGDTPVLNSPFKAERRRLMRGRIYSTPSPRRRTSARLMNRGGSRGGGERRESERERAMSPVMDCRFVTCPNCGAFHLKPMPDSCDAVQEARPDSPVVVDASDFGPPDRFLTGARSVSNTSNSPARSLRPGSPPVSAAEETWPTDSVGSCQEEPESERASVRKRQASSDALEKGATKARASRRQSAMAASLQMRPASPRIRLFDCVTAQVREGAYDGRVLVEKLQLQQESEKEEEEASSPRRPRARRSATANDDEEEAPLIEESPVAVVRTRRLLTTTPRALMRPESSENDALGRRLRAASLSPGRARRKK